MKFRLNIVLLALMPLLVRCDETKKIYKSEEYIGSIDTSVVNEVYTEDSAYDGEGDYTDEGEYTSDTAVSPWSPNVYKASATRKNDLLHEKLEVSFNWEKAWMYGKATLTLKPYFYATNQLTLDAKGMDIKEVSMLNGTTKTPLKYTYDSLQLVIDLGKQYTRNEQYQIFIDYVSRPNDRPEGGSAAITSDKGLYFINNDGKDPDKPKEIWTQGETESNSVWMPTIDKPNEKCTEEIAITIEDKYKTLSNGILVSSKKNTDGTRTDYWKMDLPHSTYLFMMAIGEFSIVKDSWKNKEVNYYVEKKYAPYAKQIFGNTPEMIDFYSTILGVQFPWQKYDQVVVRDYVSGAMENTTATLHGEFLQQTPRELLDQTWEDVICHELFHSWFGDYVTTESWSNIPLNESFATYGEYLWNEHKYGRDEADNHINDDLTNYLSEAESKQVNLIRFKYDSREDMFDAHSYQKGGRVLHMLRKYLGDDAFFAGLTKYLNDNKFANVEIENLRLAMEAVSGEDLHWFFDEWFLNAGHPSLNIDYDYDDFSSTSIVTINQYQDTATTPIYTLPIDVDIYANGTVKRERIILDKATQTFTFTTPQKPDLINVDAEKMLLCTKYDNKPLEQYIFQYNNAPLFMDRLEAVQWLSVDQYDNADAFSILSKALNDKFWKIRQFALDTINIDINTTKELTNKIIDIALRDEKSSVRVSAINRLNDLQGYDPMPVLVQAMKDSSYSVDAAALNQIFVLDPVQGLDLARQHQNEDDVNMMFSILNIFGSAGTAKENDYFIAMFKKYTDWQTYYIMTYYETYLQRMTDLSIIEKGIDQLKDVTLNAKVWWISFFGSSSITNLKTYYEDAANADGVDAATKATYQNAALYIDKALEEINSAGTNNDY